MAGDVPKKVLWIFIFLILAAIAILGVLFIRGYQSGRHVTSTESSSTPEPTEETDNQGPLSFSLDTPQTDMATTSPRLTVSGKTAPEGIVAILGNNEEVIAVAQKDGAFTTAITLVEGLNRLRFVAFNEDGEETTISRNVVYTKGAL